MMKQHVHLSLQDKQCRLKCKNEIKKHSRANYETWESTVDMYRTRVQLQCLLTAPRLLTVISSSKYLLLTCLLSVLCRHHSIHLHPVSLDSSHCDQRVYRTGYNFLWLCNGPQCVCLAKGNDIFEFFIFFTDNFAHLKLVSFRNVLYPV
jgi:hypothetical protein